MEENRTQRKNGRYNFGLATGSVFAFAGLWDRWRDPKNNVIETCTILTTRPNALVADVHDRMPAILRVEDYECWLNPGITNTETVVDCLKPFDESLMRKYPVGSRVNRLKTMTRSAPGKFRLRIQVLHCSHRRKPKPNRLIVELWESRACWCVQQGSRRHCNGATRPPPTRTRSEAKYKTQMGDHFDNPRSNRSRSTSSCASQQSTRRTSSWRPLMIAVAVGFGTVHLLGTLSLVRAFREHRESEERFQQMASNIGENSLDDRRRDKASSLCQRCV